MRGTRHENIVSYLGHGRFDGCHYIYLEYMPGGSLLQVARCLNRTIFVGYIELIPPFRIENARGASHFAVFVEPSPQVSQATVSNLLRGVFIVQFHCSLRFGALETA